MKLTLDPDSLLLRRFQSNLLANCGVNSQTAAAYDLRSYDVSRLLIKIDVEKA